MAKVEALPYDDRTVYSVAAFNRGVGQWLSRLPTVWVEGEITELRRHERWATVFFTLKDPADGSCVGVAMARGRFDALRLDLADGERVHVFGRPELYEQRGEFKLRALTIERFGVGAHLASLERLKATLAAEGLFADARKRPLPYLPRRIGIVTGNDAAAKRDVVTTICSRFPPAMVLVAVHERLRRAPALALERRRHALEHAAARLRALSPRSTLERGYAIVRAGAVVTAPPPPGTRLEIEVAEGGFGAVSE